MKKISFVLFASFMAFAPISTVYALGATQAFDPLARIVALVTAFAQLAGFAALTAALVNALKTVKVKGVPLVQDSSAGSWFAGLSLAELVFLTVAAFVKPDWSLGYLDTSAGLAAVVVNILAAYLVQLAGGLAAHKLLANYNIPLIGKSFSRP